MKNFLATLLLLLLSATATAQTARSQNVQLSGPITPGHLPVWLSTGVLKDAGTAALPANPNPITSIGVVGSGPTICAYSSTPGTSPYQRLCLATFLSSPAEITLDAFNGAPGTIIRFAINGTNYDFPFSVGGILGPNSSTIGHIATWNNTQGTLLADGGVGLLAANNLSELTNTQTARNNIGLGCPGGNGPNVTSYGSVIGVFIGCFGAKTDGSTDDTTAWGSAITYANAHPNTTIIAAPGTSLISSAGTVITAANTKIMCASGPGTCIVSHSGTPAFEVTGAGFGLFDMGIQNTGSSCNISFFIHGGSFSNVMQRIYLGNGVGIFGRWGVDASGNIGGSTLIDGIYSEAGLPNTPVCPLFDLVNGNGVMIRGALLFLNGNGVSGRNLVNANINGPFGTNQGIWDSLIIQHSFFQFFYDMVHMVLTNGGGFLDSAFENNYFGNCINICFNWTGSGQITVPSIKSNWFDGNSINQSCLSLAPTIIYGGIITGNRILLCGQSGIIIGSGAGGRASDFVIANNRIDAINALNSGTTYGIGFFGDSSTSEMNNISIFNNQIANTTAELGGHLPTVGIDVASGTVGGTVAGLQITNNNAQGVTNYIWPTIATGFVTGNIGLAPLGVNITPSASPFTYTAGAQPETVYLTGGTVSQVTTTTSITACTSTPCYINLGPGESLIVTYSGVPLMNTVRH